MGRGHGGEPRGGGGRAVLQSRHDGGAQRTEAFCREGQRILNEKGLSPGLYLCSAVKILEKKTRKIFEGKTARVAGEEQRLAFNHCSTPYRIIYKHISEIMSVEKKK